MYMEDKVEGRTSPCTPSTGEVHQVQVQNNLVELFLILKLFFFHSGNVVAVPPEVHGGQGGGGVHHHAHLVQVRYINHKSRII